VLAFLTNIGLPELIVIAVLAVLIFGKNLPQAASKAYLQARKLRNAVDDLRRESGIEREIRNIERGMREAEWEVKKLGNVAREEPKARPSATPPPATPPVAESPVAESPVAESPVAEPPVASAAKTEAAEPPAPVPEPPPGPTGAASC
jgi:Sec-independent protein translocase protein TatA